MSDELVKILLINAVSNFTIMFADTINAKIDTEKDRLQYQKNVVDALLDCAVCTQVALIDATKKNDKPSYDMLAMGDKVRKAFHQMFDETKKPTDPFSKN